LALHFAGDVGQLAIPGDFNGDGKVTAADYVVGEIQMTRRRLHSVEIAFRPPAPQLIVPNVWARRRLR